MSDPITIGAGVGAGISLLRGGNPLKGAAVGGLGGAGYGALTGSGMAGNLLSQGGLMGGPTGVGYLGSTGEIGSTLATTAGGIGTKPSMIDKGLAFMRNNPTATGAGLIAAQNLMQPTPPYNPPEPQMPSARPSQQSMQNYVPAHLLSQVQEPSIEVNAPTLGATTPYRQFGFGGANMFRDPMEYMINLNYPQY